MTAVGASTEMSPNSRAIDSSRLVRLSGKEDASCWTTSFELSVASTTTAGSTSASGSASRSSGCRRLRCRADRLFDGLGLGLRGSIGGGALSKVSTERPLGGSLPPAPD